MNTDKFRALWAKLRDPDYRKAFVGATVKRTVPFQITAIRRRRGWSQGELAKRAGLTQGAISRAEDPDYGNLTFNTVIRIANGLDLAFVGRFVPYSEFLKWYSALSEESASDVPCFDSEDARIALGETVSEPQHTIRQATEQPSSAWETGMSGLFQKKLRSPYAAEFAVKSLEQPATQESGNLAAGIGLLEDAYETFRRTQQQGNLPN